MRYNTDGHRIGLIELTYLLIGALLLILLGAFATSVAGQNRQPLYREYRGVRVGMPMTEARAKLGDPTLRSDEQDYFVFSANETAQIAYDTAHKVTMISTDYTAGIGAPDYRTVVGDGLLERPDGSVFRMVMFDSERLWVTYNKSAGVVPTVTITIGVMK